MSTNAIPAATIGRYGLAGPPVEIGLDEFRGTDVCVVSGAPGSGTTSMLLLMGSAWSPHVQVVVVGRGQYPPPFGQISPNELPSFLSQRNAATVGSRAVETVLLLDHFWPPLLEIGYPDQPPVDSLYQPVALEDVAPFDPTLFNDASLHVVMKWPRSEKSWMETTAAWNVTAVVVIALATPSPNNAFADTPFIDHRDGRPPQHFMPDIYGWHHRQ
jgi:hypothetical protein